MSGPRSQDVCQRPGSARDGMGSTGTTPRRATPHIFCSDILHISILSVTQGYIVGRLGGLYGKVQGGRVPVVSRLTIPLVKERKETLNDGACERVCQTLVKQTERTIITFTLVPRHRPTQSTSTTSASKK